MDAFDFKPEKKNKTVKKSNSRDVLFKLSAYYFFAASLCLVGYFVMIYLNPQSSLNPLRPPQPAAQTEAPAPTETILPTFSVLPSPTETAASVDAVTPDLPTLTPSVTNTFEPYPTATDVVLITNTPAPTAAALAHYTAQVGTPTYLPYSGGCNGLYLAGNVIDLNGHPVAFIRVQVSGTLGEQQISLEALSGSNTSYSESGWEIKLSDQMIASTQSLSVALYAQGNPDPISDVVFFDTFSGCTENLVVVNFEQDD